MNALLTSHAATTVSQWKPHFLCKQIRTAIVRKTHWLEWMKIWAKLLSSGLNIHDALDASLELLTQERGNRLLGRCIHKAAELMEQGQPPLLAFQNSTAEFGLCMPEALTIALRCAQASGLMGEALMGQIQHWEHDLNAKQRLLKSMAYPAFVLMACMLSVALMMHTLNPYGANTNLSHTKPMYSSAQGKNATPSMISMFMHIVFSPSQWGSLLRKHPGMTLMLFGAGLLGLALYVKRNQTLASNRRFEQGSASIQRALGSIWPQHPATLANRFYIMACELQSGIDLLQVLGQNPMPKHLAFNALRNPLFNLAENPKAIDTVLYHINQHTVQQLQLGVSLHIALKRAGAPAFLVKQAKLAEYSGDIAQCYNLAAQLFRIESERRQRRLEALSGPITLALAALILGLGYQATIAPLYANMGLGF